MSRIGFSVTDARLRSELERLVPYMHERGAVVAFDTECRFEPGDVGVICISVLPKDPGFAELEREAKRRPCGVIMRTEDRVRWRQLAEFGRDNPLLFVVATGGPREQFKDMFPKLQVVYVADLEDPYDRLVANFICDMAQQKATA